MRKLHFLDLTLLAFLTVVGTRCIHTEISSDGSENPLSLQFTEIGNREETSKVRESLLEATQKHNLKKYVFTKRIVIEDKAKAEPYPFLKIGTSFQNSSDKNLADFIHQQLQWYLRMASSDSNKLVEKYSAKYKEVPGPVEKRPTVLNQLTLGWLELQSLKNIYGPKKAYSLYLNMNKASWARKTVVADEKYLAQLIRSHGLAID